MRSIAIIGSGQIGLLTAHGLRRAGYDVTLYSDRTGEQWLRESKPTGTASRFDPALGFERSLGLNHWEAEAPPITGVHVTLCNAPGNPLLSLAGRLEKPALTIDVRLQSARWMADLEAGGGRVVIESITVDRLDAIAAEHDLTIVAAGKGALARVFPRDEARSLYDAPKRNLALALFHTHRKGFAGVPFAPVKFEILDGAGEAFMTPFFHKDHGAECWVVLVEAVPGGPFDRFRGLADGRAVLDVARDLYRDLIPWDAPFLDGVELADEHGWLLGSVTPTVRSPVGRLPSGRVVTAVGDTAVTLDPVGGQGANSGNKMAQNLVESVIARGDRPFDAAWMTETFERYWSRHGAATYAFNHMFLEPPGAAARMLLIAQHGSDGTGHDVRQRLADAFVGNFADPRELTDVVLDVGKMRAFIARTAAAPWLLPVLRGGASVAAAQLRRKLGLEQRRPEASTMGLS